MYNIQNRFIQYIGDYSTWNTDVNEGILQLDDKIYDLEYIGTTSETDNFWYSSAIERIIPDEGVQLMINARKNLEKYNLLDLFGAKIPLSGDVNGYNLSIIYMAFANADTAYFCGSGDTNVYMFVKNLDKNIFEK